MSKIKFKTFKKVTKKKLTYINESPGRALAELLALVAQSDLNDSRDVSGRRVHSNRVRRDQLAPNQHRAENHLQPVEEIVADDDHGVAALRPALGR